MASLFKKINSVASAVSTVKSVSNAVNSVAGGNLQGTAFNSALSSRNTNDAINAISGFGGQLANNALGSGGLSSALGLVSSLTGSSGALGGLISGGGFGGALGGLLGSNNLGILNNPIRVLERTAGEIFDADGGRFEEMRTLVSKLSELNAFDSFIKNIGVDLRDPLSKLGTSASRIPNPLREFSSYNYKIQLGILSNQEYNNPESYRSVGFANYIIKSTGGDLGKRVQVDQEVSSSSPGHAEYFIDNLTYDAVVAPNPKTGVTLGTVFSFTVVEPYSMGNFIEALTVAAATANNGAGYDNYFSAPFCLKIDFTGFVDGEAPEQINGSLAPIYLPMLITDIDMSVNGQGTVYECSGVAYNELGLADHMNKLYTQVHSAGSFAHTVLQTGDKSLTAGLNKRIEKLEDAEIIPGYDRFIICFPQEKDSIKNYLQSGSQAPEEKDAAQTFVEQRGTQETADELEQQGENFNNQEEATKNKQIKPVTSLFETLLAFAEDEGSMNEIGLSQLLSDASQGGNQDAPSLNGSYQADNPSDVDSDIQAAKDDPCGGEEITPGLVDKNAAALTPGEFSRTYEFNKSEAITTCIEKVLLNTEYCKDNASKDGDENGLRTWFTIESQVYLEEDAQTEADMGRPPCIVVYSVMPYKTTGAKFLKGNQTPKNIGGLKEAAAKEYNYLYTGNNEDVLNFDIVLNTAFMRTVSANYGNASGSNTAGTADVLVVNPEESGATTSGEASDSEDTKEGKPGTKEVGKPSVASATRDKDIRRQVAENFHDILINSPTDLVTAEMQIWGDPFYLPQEIGNYHPARSGSSPNTTEDGTMTYTDGEVLVVVNFRTPFDYEDGGSLAEMPILVPQFSGLYSVISVSNVFNKGQFTQDLRLVRSPLQDKTKITENFVAGMKVGETPSGYKPSAPPNAGMISDFQILAESSSSFIKEVNQAANLLSNAVNSGASISTSIGQLAQQAQSSFSNLASTGSTASQALNNLASSAGSTANQAANAFSSASSALSSFDAGGFASNIPDVSIPGSFGSGSFGLDQASAITNALASAVPAFGQISVDLTSTEGKLAIAGADLQAKFEASFEQYVPPELENKATELAETVQASVQNADLTSSVPVSSDQLIKLTGVA